MEHSLTRLFSGLARADELETLVECNALTARFGLTLTKEQLMRLLDARDLALQENGRVEFGQGVLKKLIEAFCDSPYLMQDNYAETLAELQEAFYYFKGEAMERLCDDELIEAMKTVFDGIAQGSVSYLTETSLELLCRAARTGGAMDLPQGGPALWDEDA